jgi:hypothetical protein
VIVYAPGARLDGSVSVLLATPLELAMAVPKTMAPGFSVKVAVLPGVTPVSVTVIDPPGGTVDADPEMVGPPGP